MRRSGASGATSCCDRCVVLPPLSPQPHQTLTRLLQIFQRDTAYIPSITDAILPHLHPLPPLKLPYTIRLDADFHRAAAPTPTIYDLRVCVDQPLRQALHDATAHPAHLAALQQIADLNDEQALVVQALGHHKSKHAFLSGLAADPARQVRRWLSSQKRDLEVIYGEASRGGGEDAAGEEWRRGGQQSVWGSENVRESVTLMLSQRAQR
jgi:SWI/SNF-related matrix-associated actin-dependent regulator of chromatin subfamily D